LAGFSGRILEDYKDGPKYINTKDTFAYHKGEIFFGLNNAKEDIKKENQAIIVEGEFDAISLFREGIKNVVAIKGTALTAEQARLLARFCQKVVLSLDSDEAGFEALKRSLSVLEKENFISNVLEIPEGKDPDEAINKNPGLFKGALKKASGAYDFLIDQFSQKYDNKTAEGKRKITDELLPLFSQINNEIIKEHYIKKLSDKLETSYQSLLKEIDKLESVKEKEKITPSSKNQRDRRDLLEEYLLGLIVQSEDPRKILEMYNPTLKMYKFSNSSYQKLFESLTLYVKNGEKFKSQDFLKVLQPQLVSAFDTCYIFPLPHFINEVKYLSEVKKVLDELLTLFVKEEIKELSQKIKEDDGKSLETLNKRISELLSFVPKS
jgi:DNA primase